jgi:hypothetical protein
MTAEKPTYVQNLVLPAIPPETIVAEVVANAN